MDNQNITGRRHAFFKGFSIGTSQYRLLAFLIPALTYFLVYAAMLIYPFGNGTVLVLDLNGQYVYFFEALRDALTGNGSIIYSFERALSGEFLGIFAYYLASPLSFIVALFPKNAIQEAILVIMLIKCGLCGLTSNIYITKTRKIPETGALIFSCCYALCAYTLVYASNTMWIDCMYLLPLIVLGIERLITERKYFLYTASLTAALLSNFYIGYMVCIFSAVYFIIFYFSNSEGERGSSLEKAHFIKSGLRFCLFSLISACIASPLIFPMLYSLGFGKNDFSNPKFDFSVKTEFIDIFTKLLPASYDTVRPEGMPFVYCSVLCVIFAVLYFVCPKISSRKKAAYGILLAFLAFSFCGSTIDLAWHGFQFPNWLNFRYSFIFTFIFIVIACDAFANIKDIKPAWITSAVMIFVIVCSFVQKIEYKNINKLACIWSAVICSFVMLAGVRAAIKNPVRGSAVLLVLTLAELLGNGIASEYMMNEDVGFSKHSSYSGYVEKYRAMAATVKDSDPSLYRSENLDFRKVNDNYAIGLYGISGSTSTLNKNVIDFLSQAGYSSRSHHSNYSGCNPVGDSLLGIKYVLGQNSDIFDPKYVPVFANPENKTVAYENPYALPLAYTVNAEFENFDTALSPNPFELMNRMCTEMLNSGENYRIFESDKYDLKLENAERTTTSNMRKYKRVRENSGARMNFVITAEHDGVLYAYFPVTNGYRKETNVKFGETEIKNYFLSDNHGFICLGEHKTGDVVYLSLTLEETELYLNQTNYFYTLNSELFDVVIQKFRQDSSAVSPNFSDTGFSGTVEVKDGRNMLMFTLPYDKNFAVYINGEKKETVEIADIYTGVILDDGTYEYKIVYKPAELYAGLLTALAGIIIFIVYTAAARRRRTKRSSLPRSTGASAESEITEGTDADTGDNADCTP